MLTDNWRIGVVPSSAIPIAKTHALSCVRKLAGKDRARFQNSEYVSVGAQSKEPNELGEIPRGIRRVHEMKEK